jgi:hypothetical protein
MEPGEARYNAVLDIVQDAVDNEATVQFLRNRAILFDWYAIGDAGISGSHGFERLVYRTGVPNAYVFQDDNDHWHWEVTRKGTVIEEGTAGDNGSAKAEAERAAEAFMASPQAPTDTTKVIFRILEGDVIAVFPELPGTNDPNTCQSYMHLGQHGSADPYVGRRPATPAEYDAVNTLAAELRRIGYKLVIRKRVTPAMTAARHAELTPTGDTNA